MQTLYPAIKTYATHSLAVDSTHTLYIEECGNPDGLPVVVLHSGPGTGCDSYHRRLFDPEVFRIILFDQRGAGRSTPHAELKDNTTSHLIADIEAIRQHLNIPRWIVWGGAWGALLALLYAQAHPSRTMGLILHSVFLGRKQDIDWFYTHGANLVFPDYWQDFVQAFPEDQRSEPLKAYYERLNDTNELTRMATAKAWSLWQARCSALQPHHQILDHFSDPHLAVGLAAIESYYFVNRCFIEENQVMHNLDALTDIPTHIIHGRYDMVCPFNGAWELHQGIPGSELYIIRDAGHAAKEPGIIDAIVLATKAMAQIHTNTA